MYFSSQDRGAMSAMVYNWPHDEVDVIVVTDGSRVLGLGDLGANGMQVNMTSLIDCSIEKRFPCVLNYTVTF